MQNSVKYLHESNQPILDKEGAEFSNKAEILENIGLRIEEMKISPLLAGGVTLGMILFTLYVIWILFRVAANFVSAIESGQSVTTLLVYPLAFAIGGGFAAFTAATPYLVYRHRKKVEQPEYNFTLYNKLMKHKRFAVGEIVNLSSDGQRVQIKYKYRRLRSTVYGKYITSQRNDLNVGDQVAVIYSPDLSVLV